MLTLTAIAVVLSLMHPLFLSGCEALPFQSTRNIGKRQTGTLNETATTLIDVILDAPPRYMWGWGPGLHGYCGATSFQTNGIYWGNWVSSEKVRDADGGEELLIAVNDEAAATALQFMYEEWNYNTKTPQATKFVDWIRNHIDAGHIVVIGVYEMQPEGDADYDHIVPVIGYQYESATGDVTGLYFNDLWSTESRMLAIPNGIAARKDCRQSDAPEQPFTYCLPQKVDYGIAFLGNVDVNAETYRMQLTMPSWTEPDYGHEDNINAKPVLFTVSAAVSGLRLGGSYTVYRFDAYATLPTSNFSSGPYTKQWSFVASAEVHELPLFDTFMSNSTIFYRTVASN